MPKYRMIHVDHYMSKPVSPFDDTRSEVSGRQVSKVPIIRIFGADSSGRKICIHVHGFYPYVAIQNREPNDPDISKRIVNDIEKAVGDIAAESYNERLEQQRGTGQSKSKNQQQQSRPQQQVNQQNDQPSNLDTIAPDEDSNLDALGHPTNLRNQQGNYTLSADQSRPVHRIEPILTFNYYGYHEKPEPFFKLYLYNPRSVKQLATAFEKCKILERFIPVFWAHLPYILLFFIDNNLRGMQFIELDQMYWRQERAPSSRGSQTSGSTLRPGSTTRAGSVRSQQHNQEDIDRHTTDIEPTSTCELEADVRFEWIVNRQRFNSEGNDDALKKLWMDDQEETQSRVGVESRLPLYNLERDYLEQLCECYGVNRQQLDLAITDRERPSQEPLQDPLLSDSDDSFIAFKDNEDHIPEPESSPPAPVVESEVKPEKLKEDWPVTDEEFSDDDEFMNTIPKLEAFMKTEPSSSPPKLESAPPELKIKTEPQVKFDPEGPMVTSNSKESPSLDIKTKIEPNETTVSNEPAGDDEFSDDEEFLKDVAKAEATMKNYTENSIIDGKSWLGSTTRTRSGSQRSNTSSREAVNHEYQYFCIISMELHVSTRGKLRPDPVYDPIEAVFYCTRNDIPETSSKSPQIVGMIITDPFRNAMGGKATSPNVRSPGSRSNLSFAQKLRSLLNKTGLSMHDVEFDMVDTEIELIMALVEVVKTYDPEILVGYEMERLSWGYVLERSTVLNFNISTPLSRVTDNTLGNNSKVVDSGFVQPIIFTGRMVFSTWRIIRHEHLLNTCSYERMHHYALNERVPCFSFETLTNWFNTNRSRWRVIDYYLIRVVGQMRILDKFDLITKVSELARVYGTQFIDVITRGSQIGIESMMLRLAKLQNLTPLSATVMQRHKMKAPEALPLVMEPETNIYYDPVAVLDFQSLYPSVVIAYNYCFSTCLGRVSDLEGKKRHQFGCSQLHVPEEEVKRLLESNSVHVSPCGVAFAKKSIRHGILPKMLNELILTRAMVKDQMKKNMKSERPNRRLQRILDHRQHGLKMMANTTYGYTGASYTGRMPCVEIADSIVSKGRETLENAIELVESREEWGAKVIYGDTDSIFIQFANCDRNTAFKRAYEMVDAITAQNPHPIKMKFEKIYQPCVLQTKKRYCGFKFESPDQVRPEFEAKGIETVRRDCCPAAARMLEMALRIQFTTRDINEVKKYVQHQFVKIMSGKLSNIQDFIFARQYKPRDLDKQESVFVPAWQITKRLLASDPRAEPRFNERVPFVIIYGEPKTPLVNLAKLPIEVLENLSYRINSDYYIQKIICPTLNRVFCTMKVDTLLWYKSMPHLNSIHRSHYLVAQLNQRSGNATAGPSNKQSTMSQYFSPSHCPVCAKSIPITDDICHDCRGDLQSSVIRLTEEIARNQRKLFAHHQLCRACSSLERGDMGGDDLYYNPCISYDCQNLFRYHQAKLDALNTNFLSQILKSLN